MHSRLLCGWSFLALSATLAGAATAAEPDADLTVLKERLLALALHNATSPETIRQYVDTMTEEGAWPDIDYRSQSMATWPTNGHASRLWALAAAYRRADSPFRGDRTLLAATLRGWDWWRDKDPISPNWWNNRIGVPRVVYRMMLLLEGEMSAEQWAYGIKVLERGKMGLVGQNLMWTAEVTAARGVLKGDAVETAEAFGRIARETRLSAGEGIQADGSFLQHGLMLYSGGYGRGFATDCSAFARLAAGTAFALPPEAIANLSMYLLDGEQWVIRGNQIDYSTAGREIVRRGYGNASGMLQACEDMSAIDPPRRAEFEAWARRLQSPPGAPDPPLVGNRHFWRGDLMAHHRPTYYASVRMPSARLRETEVVNEENKIGQRLADGVNFLYLDGAEYAGIFPVWDWQRLPGITCELTGDTTVTMGKPGERTFVGGVSDGLYGLAAMDFSLEALSARKAWFFADDAYLCIGTGITCASDKPVVTTLNQCLLRGEVRCGSEAPPLGSGSRTRMGERWLHHGGVGYVFPAPTDVAVSNRTQTGSWLRIAPVPDEEAAVGVFLACLEHGAGPRDARYAYTVVPGVSAEETAAFAGSPTVEVLTNEPRLQAARATKAGVVGIAAYEGGAIDLPGLPRLTVSQPCLLLWREVGDEVALSVSNPENEAATIEVRVAAHLTGAWARPEGEGTVLRYELPGDLVAGSTVTHRFGR